jgi:anti-sigma28 factor (negative regulator of flagellin synthesis)
MIRGISSQNINNYQVENQKNKQKVQDTKKLSRVEEIKRAIENGTYKVDIEKTAKAMANALS